MSQLGGKALRRASYLILILLLASGYSSLHAQAPDSEKPDSKDLPNFYRVDESYLRGGQPTEAGLRKLADMGVKTVIDLRDDNGNRDEREKKFAEELGMQYVNISISTWRAPDEKQIQRLMTLLRDKERAPVYVHCWLGNDRTGLATGLYRIEFHDWTAEQAFEEMKATGFSVPPLRRGMKSYLFKYAKRKEPSNGTASTAEEIK